MFRSRNLDSKLRGWALSLQEYDIDLRRLADSANLVPDCLSRLPHPAQKQSHIDDSFRDDTLTMTPSSPSQQSDPALDVVALQELNMFDEPAAKLKQPAEATAAENTTAIASALRELSFATCASLDNEQRPVRRSSRIREPSVRLRDPDDPTAHRRRPGRGKADIIPRRWTPVPVDVPQHEPQPNQIVSTSITVFPKENDTDPSSNKHTTASSSAAVEIDDILFAGGGGNELLDGRQGASRTAAAIERALKVLTETSLLVTQQNNDPFLKQITNSLAEKKTCQENDRYLIDEKGLVWYTPDNSKIVLTVPRSIVPELFALVHTLHGHAGVGATLALVRGHFHWPAIARDTPLYVASCGQSTKTIPQPENRYDARTCRGAMGNPRSRHFVH